MFLMQLIVVFVYFHASASEQVILKWKMSYKQRFFPCVNLMTTGKKFSLLCVITITKYVLDNNEMF